MNTLYGGYQIQQSHLPSTKRQHLLILHSVTWWNNGAFAAIIPLSCHTTLFLADSLI